VTRDEYLALLETEPASPNQRGAIMRECDRFGLTDRAERLTACAVLLGLDDLGSTAELTMGQAGQLVNALEHTARRADLPDVARGAGQADDGQGDDDGSGGMSIAGALGCILLMVALTVHGKDLQVESGHMPPNIRRLCASRVFTPASADHSERMREKDDSQ
jgi:hypothetical protein